MSRYDHFHKLPDDARAFVDELVAAEGLRRAAARFGTGSSTLETLLQVGSVAAYRDRIANAARGMHAAKLGLPQPEPIRTPRKEEIPRTKVDNTLLRRPRLPPLVIAGLAIGQQWELVEPSGTRLLVEITAIARGMHGVPRVWLRTRSGKVRSSPASVLSKGKYGSRLVRDVERRAS